MFTQVSNDAFVQKISAYCLYGDYEGSRIAATVLTKEYAVSALHCVPEPSRQLNHPATFYDCNQREHAVHIHGLNTQSDYVVFKKNDGEFKPVPELMYPMVLGKYIAAVSR